MFKSTLILFVLSLSLANAAYSTTDQSKYSVEGHYKHFEYNYSPKELFVYAQKATVWLSKMCKKGKKQCKKALTEFNGPKQNGLR